MLRVPGSVSKKACLERQRSHWRNDCQQYASNKSIFVDRPGEQTVLCNSLLPTPLPAGQISKVSPQQSQTYCTGVCPMHISIGSRKTYQCTFDVMKLLRCSGRLRACARTRVANGKKVVSCKQTSDSKHVGGSLAVEQRIMVRQAIANRKRAYQLRAQSKLHTFARHAAPRMRSMDAHIRTDCAQDDWHPVNIFREGADVLIACIYVPCELNAPFKKQRLTWSPCFRYGDLVPVTRIRSARPILL